MDPTVKAYRATRFFNLLRAGINSRLNPNDTACFADWQADRVNRVEPGTLVRAVDRDKVCRPQDEEE